MAFYSNRFRAPAKKTKWLLVMAVGVLLLGFGVDLMIKLNRVPENFVEGAGVAKVGSYQSTVRIRPDSSVVIAENMNLEIEAEGKAERFRRPLSRYRGDAKNRTELTYTVTRTQHMGPGEKALKDIARRIEISERAVLVTVSQGASFPVGQHTFLTEYEVRNLVEHTEDLNELTWNVTGTYAREPLNNVTATIKCPPILASDSVGYSIDRKAGYNQPEKLERPISEIATARLEEYPDPSRPGRKIATLLIQTKAPLLPYEGIEVTVTWPRQQGM
jgi:hypothetical protein